MKSSHSIVFTIAPAVALLLAACASQPPADVTAQMARTQVVIEQAERNGVQERSLQEIEAAKRKFSEAQALLAKKDDDAAREAVRLAQQAEVDAQYASAKAQAERQKEATREVQQSLDALKQEATRNASPGGAVQ